MNVRPLVKCCCRGPRCVAPNGPVQLVSNFSKYHRNKDGMNNLCKCCDSADKGHTHRPKPELPAGYKMCSRGTRCKNSTGAIQLVANFYKNTQSRDGLTYACKACMYAQMQQATQARKQTVSRHTASVPAYFNA
jgi:hypothetical protein